MTFEQTQAALLTMNGQPLPLDLIAALINQGIIISEFLRTYQN